MITHPPDNNGAAAGTDPAPEGPSPLPAPGNQPPGNSQSLARAEEVHQPALPDSALPGDGMPELPPLPKFRATRIPVIDWAAKRAEIVAVVLSLLVSALFVPQVLNFSHRNDPERAIMPHVPLWKSFEAWEYSLYDYRFARRGPVASKAIDRVAIVAIDDKSINALKQWPWPRSWHAQLINRLHAAGAKVIAFDLVLSEKSPDDKDDQALADAMGAANKTVVLATEVTQQKSGERGESTASYSYRSAAPLDALDQETADECMVNVQRDSDDHVRLYPFRALVSGANLGSLATLSAAAYQNILDGQDNKTYDDKWLAKNRWPTESGTVKKVPIVGIVQPKSMIAPHFWNMLLQYWGPAGTFKTYSYSDVLKPEVMSDSQLKSLFQGKIVLVGATSTILKDIFPMPQFEGSDQTTFNSSQKAQISGVEMHASAIAMLLDGYYLRAVSLPVMIATLFGFSLLCSLWTVIVSRPINRFSRSAQYKWSQWWTAKRGDRPAPFRVNTIIWVVSFLVLVTLPFVVSNIVAQQLFNSAHLWVIVVYPWLSALLATAVVLLMLFSIESAELMKTQRQFGRYVAPEVMEEILAHEEEDWPRPRRAHVTVLFTDLEGFTTYSENHEPEEVIEALNSYMDRMMPILAAHGGTFDKYIGDAIMAYFGAPVPRFDHAAQALHCAVAMQEECVRFREETGIDFYMRIGVHTGDCIVGSMGAAWADRLQYTAIGDTVNLASRLEGKNKEFGSHIMCSRATFEAAPDVVEVESAAASIKGKSQSVEVYIVRGLKGLPECDKQWGRQLTAGAGGELANKDASAQLGDNGELPALPAANRLK